MKLDLAAQKKRIKDLEREVMGGAPAMDFGAVRKLKDDLEEAYKELKRKTRKIAKLEEQMTGGKGVR